MIVIPIFVDFMNSLTGFDQDRTAILGERYNSKFRLFFKKQKNPVPVFDLTN